MNTVIEETLLVFQSFADQLGRLWPLVVATLAVFAGLKFTSRKIREAMAEQVAPLVAELSPNGGGSIKDQVKRVDETTQQAIANQAELAEQLEALSAEVSAAGSRVQALRSSTDRPYVEMDANLNHTFVNKAFADLFGIPYEEAHGDMLWESRVHPDDVHRLQQTADMLIKAPQAYVTESRVVNVRDNVLQHVVTYGYPIYGPHKVLRGYAASVVVMSTEPLSAVDKRWANDRL
jgi:PAS domain S-box-containing protein